MIKFAKINLIILSSILITGCSEVLQSVDLEIDSKDISIQEKFNVIEKTLTLREARKHKNALYMRTVLQNGTGNNARTVPESFALKSNFPKSEEPYIYKIGIGDTLTFSQFIENNQSPSEKETQWPQQLENSPYKLGIGDTLTLTLIKTTASISQSSLNNLNNTDNNQNLIGTQQNDSTISSRGRIGSDGSVLLLEVGRLEANGKTLNELRSDENIFVRNGVSPRFQLEI